VVSVQRQLFWQRAERSRLGTDEARKMRTCLEVACPRPDFSVRRTVRISKTFHGLLEASRQVCRGNVAEPSLVCVRVFVRRWCASVCFCVVFLSCVAVWYGCCCPTLVKTCMFCVVLCCTVLCVCCAVFGVCCVLILHSSVAAMRFSVWFEQCIELKRTRLTKRTYTTPVAAQSAQIQLRHTNTHTHTHAHTYTHTHTYRNDQHHRHLVGGYQARQIFAMEIDYYVVLGVTRTASGDEIKKA